jgi:endonuclease/exonuclease/phosphatase family metal-dependent hydrolase
MRILNLHLTHLRGEQSSALRAGQLIQALDWAYEGLVGGLVVAGDLNAAASDPALVPLNAQVGFDMTTFIGARSNGPQGEGLAIDHLLLQQPGGWSVASRFRALDQGDDEGWRPSDHAAVVIDLIAT